MTVGDSCCVCENVRSMGDGLGGLVASILCDRGNTELKKLSRYSIVPAVSSRGISFSSIIKPLWK